MGLSFKLFGSGFSEQLISITTNPFVGLFIGILATSIVQSSSVTTSVVVGLTASGALTVSSAIPIIMGANIGTSITNLIVSLGHITQRVEFKKAFQVAIVHDLFNFIVVLILFPLEMFFHILEKSAIFLGSVLWGAKSSLSFSSPLDYIIKPAANLIKNILGSSGIWILILAFVLLFFSLRYFVEIMKPLAKTEFKHLMHKHIFNYPLRSFGVGIFLTALVQSSSVTTSLIVPLAGVGILSLKRAFPYILGANIGTTITALLASLVTGSPIGVTVAIAHILFNCFGTLIVYPIRRIPIKLSRAIAGLTFKSRVYPVAYIIGTFYIVPSFIIFFFR